MEEGWGRTIGCSRPCKAHRLDPEEQGGGAAAPTPVMAGSASRMSLARDSAKPPSPARSSTSETTVLLRIFYVCLSFALHVIFNNTSRKKA